MGKQESLKSFQVQIAELKRQEEENGKTVHFSGIDPYELVEEDKNLYEEFLFDRLDDKKLMKHINSLSFKPGNKSRKQFAGYLGNMLSIKNLDKFLRK